MVPLSKVQDLITKHSKLEKELSSQKIDKKLYNFIEKTNIPFMSFPGDEEFIDAYHEFYNKLLNKEELSLIGS